MKTAKEVANFLGYPIAKDFYSAHLIDKYGSWSVYERIPTKDLEEEIWKPQKNSWWTRIQPGLINDPIYWEDSLTVPDSWNEKDLTKN